MQWQQWYRSKKSRLPKKSIFVFLWKIPKLSGNKKDGYRQQNVRQRQKLISIIDYDVCMTFY